MKFIKTLMLAIAFSSAISLACSFDPNCSALSTCLNEQNSITGVCIRQQQIVTHSDELSRQQPTTQLR